MGKKTNGKIKPYQPYEERKGKGAGFFSQEETKWLEIKKGWSVRGIVDHDLPIIVSLLFNSEKGWAVYPGSLLRKGRYYWNLRRAKKIALRGLVFRLRLLIERLEEEIDGL